MRNRIALLLVSLLASLGLAAAAPSPASASFNGNLQAGYGVDLATGKLKVPSAAERQYLALTCPSGYICFIENSNPIGGAAEPIPQTWTGCRKLTTLDNRTSYIWNATGYTWHVWEYNSICDHPQGTGTIYPNTKAAMSSAWNDNITHYHRH